MKETKRIYFNAFDAELYKKIKSHCALNGLTIQKFFECTLRKEIALSEGIPKIPDEMYKGEENENYDSKTESYKQIKFNNEDYPEKTQEVNEKDRKIEEAERWADENKKAYEDEIKQENKKKWTDDLHQINPEDPVNYDNGEDEDEDE